MVCQDCGCVVFEQEMSRSFRQLLGITASVPPTTIIIKKKDLDTRHQVSIIDRSTRSLWRSTEYSQKDFMQEVTAFIFFFKGIKAVYQSMVCGRTPLHWFQRSCGTRQFVYIRVSAEVVCGLWIVGLVDLRLFALSLVCPWLTQKYYGIHLGCAARVVVTVLVQLYSAELLYGFTIQGFESIITIYLCWSYSGHYMKCAWL